MTDTGNEALRAAFGEKADELCRNLDALRPGTGPGIRVLLMMAWDDGYAAGAAARPDSKTIFLHGVEFGYRQANSDRALRQTMDEAEKYFDAEAIRARQKQGKEEP